MRKGFLMGGVGLCFKHDLEGISSMRDGPESGDKPAPRQAQLQFPPALSPQPPRAGFDLPGLGMGVG